MTPVYFSHLRDMSQSRDMAALNLAQGAESEVEHMGFDPMFMRDAGTVGSHSFAFPR